MLNRIKIMFFDRSPRWLLFMIMVPYWKLHPKREDVFAIPDKKGWKVMHDGFLLFIPHRNIVQSLGLPPPCLHYLELNRGEVVLDIGAAVGEDTIHFSKEVGPEGRVIAVEANPNNVKYLRKNVEQNRIENVEIVEKAVWNKKDALEFYLAERPTDGSLFINHHPDSKKTGEIVRVPADTLDIMVQGYNVDFIKANIEGAELEMLEGAEKTLEKAKRVFVTTDHLRDGEYTTERVMRVLESKGFNVEWVSPKRCRYVVGRK